VFYDIIIGIKQMNAVCYVHCARPCTAVAG